ncbi:cilia- and flagella-associated protein 97-like [Pomacea canaliculata]|nr:cilia- and flagella-associated protein 97-like [Pomacea canaliculata]
MCDSDSDMTDVSPISSPRDGFLNGHGENTSHSRSHEPKSVHFKKYKPVSLNEETTAHRDYADNGNAIDLNILMKAVSEIEKEKRVKAQTRRVMFEPVQAKSCGKTNYTFSCDDTDRIEKENKRLLQEILKCMHSNSEKRQQKVADPSIKRSTLTASAINRRRDQKRIENENLAFLKRLQSVRPSKGISRQEQLHAYNSTVLHGVPISALHPAPSYRTLHSDRSSNFSMADSLDHRTYSQNSLRSTASLSVSSASSHQSSRAGSRPTSAKMAERPPWNDRW